MHCRYSQPTLVSNPAEIVEINGFVLNRVNPVDRHDFKDIYHV